MDKKHELKNKYMHTDFENECVTQSASSTIPKCKNCTLEELAIIQEIAKNPVLTQKELDKDWYFCVGFGVAWQHFLKVVHGGYDKIGGINRGNINHGNLSSNLLVKSRVIKYNYHSYNFF